MKNSSRFSGAFRYLPILVLTGMLAHAVPVGASGISIDAGLTPAQNKWVIRTQVRYMQREAENSQMTRKMDMWMYPLVVAYGVRSDLTVMAMQMHVRNKMTMGAMSNSESGFGNLMLMAKYRLLRLNRPSFTLGMAPVLGLRMPTGEQEFGSDNWDLRTGLFVSSRLRTWSLDFNLAYDWNGMAGVEAEGVDPGDELVIQAALGRQISLTEDAVWALAPVMEASYLKVTAAGLEGQDLVDSGEEVLIVAPGAKVTRSNVVVEGLVQFPVWQDQKGDQLERRTGFLLGLRLMF